jgi:hypothetical protein
MKGRSELNMSGDFREGVRPACIRPDCLFCQSRTTPQAGILPGLKRFFLMLLSTLFAEILARTLCSVLKINKPVAAISFDAFCGVYEPV